MKIGAYDLYSIETGTFYLDGGSVFGSIPKVLWEKYNKSDELNRIELSARSLLIIGNGKIILMDDGVGTKLTDKYIHIYRLDNSKFTLSSSLKKYGVISNDITDVIISHLHFDHAGGSTIRENGVLKPAFPNAKYYIQKTQWEHALNPTERDRGSFIPVDFLPLKEHNLIELVDGEIEFSPQISIIVSNGHTPGLQMLKISDGTTTLFASADLIPMTSHTRLAYITGFDLRPLETLKDKKTLLKQAVDERWILFFGHDPKIVAGIVKKNENDYALDKPVEFN